MFQIPRGTRDFTSTDMQKRKIVEERIKSTFQKFGYKEIQTPIFETLELFTAKSGDQIIDELYSFQDKGGRHLALRPELTAPVIRMYVDKLQMDPKPLKLFYIGNCFRYDRPQKGRYREFKQAGCEIIGVDTPESYAELISMAFRIMQNIGLKNIELKIGNLDILKSIFKKIKIPENKQKYLTPLIDKEMYDDLIEALQDLDIKSNDYKKLIDILQTNDIKKISEFVKDDKSCLEELEKMEQILDLIKNSFEINKFRIKMSIVRGLDYYKGIVFEIEAPELGAEKQLCGGGAYDLIPLFGGSETPTAGFAIGFDRAILALETEEYKFPDEKIDVFVISINNEMINKSIKMANDLRNNGLSVDIDLMRRGIGKSLKYASSVNVKKAVIVGPDELKLNSVTVRDMNSGEQIQVQIKDLADYLLKNL